MDSRRTALIKIASAAIAPLLANTPEAEHHAHELLAQNTPPLPAGPDYFSQGDYATLSKLADLIIPRTDTPGAIDAGVPHWIDRHVAADPELQSTFKQGLAYLGSDFAALSEPQQIAILQALSTNEDKAKSGFFQTVKDLTVEGFYNSEPGLVQELGYKGNTFRASFPGCTHPEHWPSEEHSQ